VPAHSHLVINVREKQWKSRKRKRVLYVSVRFLRYNIALFRQKYNKHCREQTHFLRLDHERR